MNKPNRHTYLAVLALLVLGQVGCATLRPSEETRAKLGTIGVASAQFTPQVNQETPPRGSAAGAARGAVGGLAVGGPGGVLALPVLVPLFAILGAATAPSAEEVEKAEVALERAFADLMIQDALRDRVFDLARTGTDAPVVLLRGRGPTTLHDKPDYRSETGEGINTVLEVRVLTIVLCGRCGPVLNFGNPTFKLEVAARARLVQTLDGAELFTRSFFHRGGTDKFAGWAEKDAERLRAALNLAAAEIAKEIVDNLVRAPSEPAP